MWYTPHEQLTYNRIFNFVVGVRGGGKTFNTLKTFIELYEKGKGEFVYLRRRAVDLDDACTGGDGSGDLFSDIQKQGYFEGVELKAVADKSGGYNFYYNDKIMGYGRALSTARRSASLPNVNRIVYDEFLIDPSKSHERYLSNGEEMFAFNNFYETIARGRDIPTFFLGNAFSMVNPYFLTLNIRIPDIKPNKIYKGKAWTFVEWRDPDFIEMRQNTQFYQATKGTQFSEHAYSNKYYLDRQDFVKKRPEGTEHHFSLVYLGSRYGVWVDWDKGIYYVSSKGANAPKEQTISMSLEDNKPNNINIRRYRNYPFMKAFRLAVTDNRVYFDSQETYNKMHEVVYLLRTIT